MPSFNRFDLPNWIAMLERTPIALGVCLRELDPALVDVTEGPDTWSPRMVVAHLIQGERTDWIPRARMILAQGENRRFEPFDRFAYLRTPLLPMDDLLDEFRRERAQNLDTLRSWKLTPSKLDLEGEHPELGTVTLRQLIATWVAHDLGHINQISRVLARYLRSDVGPWRKYLSVMDR